MIRPEPRWCRSEGTALQVRVLAISNLYQHSAHAPCPGCRRGLATWKLANSTAYRMQPNCNSNARGGGHGRPPRSVPRARQSRHLAVLFSEGLGGRWLVAPSPSGTHTTCLEPSRVQSAADKIGQVVREDFARAHLYVCAIEVKVLVAVRTSLRDSCARPHVLA